MEKVIDRMFIKRQFDYTTGLPIKAYLLNSLESFDLNDIKNNLYLSNDFSEFFDSNNCAICFARRDSYSSENLNQIINVAIISNFKDKDAEIKYASMIDGERVKETSLVKSEQKILKVENAFRRYILETGSRFDNNAKDFVYIWPRLPEYLIDSGSKLTELCRTETPVENKFR